MVLVGNPEVTEWAGPSYGRVARDTGVVPIKTKVCRKVL